MDSCHHMQEFNGSAPFRVLRDQLGAGGGAAVAFRQAIRMTESMYSLPMPIRNRRPQVIVKEKNLGNTIENLLRLL